MTTYRTSKAVRSDLNSRSNSGVLGLLLVVVVIAIIAAVVLTVVLPMVDEGVKQACASLPDVIVNASNGMCK